MAFKVASLSSNIQSQELSVTAACYLRSLPPYSISSLSISPALIPSQILPKGYKELRLSTI